ncbi:hypothetical protein Hanom_Chr09g00788671 [Helianthus anomalus]
MAVALCSGARFEGRRGTEVAPTNKYGLTDLIHQSSSSRSISFSQLVCSKPYHKLFQNKIQSVGIKENILVGS